MRRGQPGGLVVGMPVAAPGRHQHHVLAVGPDRRHERGTSSATWSASVAVGQAQAGHGRAGCAVGDGCSSSGGVRRPAARECAWAMPGWEPSPAVAETTSTCQPARAAAWIRPPAPRVSSSGWAPTTQRAGGAWDGRPRLRHRVGRPARWSTPIGGRAGPVVAEVRPRHQALAPGRASVPAQGGLVALRVPLAQVELEVGHPAGVVLVGGERARAQAVGCATQHVLGGQGHRPRGRAVRHASRRAGEHARVERRTPPASSVQRAAWSCASTAPRCISATWSGGRVGRRAEQPAGDTDGAAEPDRGHPEAAPGEAGPLEVPARIRRPAVTGTPVEVDRTGVDRGQAAGDPGAGHRRHPGVRAGRRRRAAAPRPPGR